MTLNPIPVFLLTTFLCSGVYASTRYGKANSEVRGGINACLAFEAAYGCYPPQHNWLEELVGGDNAIINTDKCGYLNAQIPFIDPWGNPYIYKIPGKYNPGSFDFYSMGRDGKSKTGGNDPDDISVWNDKAYRVYNPIITPTRAIYLLFCFLLVAAVVTTGIRKRAMSKKEWHALFTRSVVVLCILVPILNAAVFSGDRAFRQTILIFPAIVGLSPIAVDLLRRKWIFNVWGILIVWLYAFILLLLSVMLSGRGYTR